MGYQMDMHGHICNYGEEKDAYEIVNCIFDVVYLWCIIYDVYREFEVFCSVLECFGLICSDLDWFRVILSVLDRCGMLTVSLL